MRTSFAAMTLVLLLGQGGQTQNAAEPVKVQLVKYEVLREAIVKNRGKVVLVDFWGFF